MSLAFVSLVTAMFLSTCPIQSQAVTDIRMNQTSAAASKIMLASTIGPIDAGIVEKLEEAFTKKTGIIVEHQGAGTGEALKMAETGKFDLVLVHARDLEEKFIADGFGTMRFDLMYNDFVILGPASDPAGIRSTKDAAVALRRIADSKAIFVTRGDQSGTHSKEMEIWRKSGIDPHGVWYCVFEQGAKGNALTLAHANEKQAYTIMDRATYITMRRKTSLQILVEREEILSNYISLIPVNPDKFPGIKHKEAMEFVNWLQSKEAQTIIRDFGEDRYGEPLFFPNSPEGKKLM
jgi:tungstate transport system substrate-binding protein